MEYNKHKIYRVRKITNSLGEVAFRVEAAKSWIWAFCGEWTVYTRENESLDEAIEHIRILSKCRIVFDKIVYRTNLKKTK